MNILITGGNGQLGREFKRIKNNKHINILITDINELDIISKKSINNFLKNKAIDCIINCAAYTDVKKAEVEKKEAMNVNSIGVKNLVDYCEKNNTKLIHISTDYVYNAMSTEKINEDEFLDPQNYYGYSKRCGEIHIENSLSESIVIRTSWLYSKFGKNFVNTVINKSKENSQLHIVNDQFGCPTYARDFAKDLIKIANKKNLSLNGKIFNYSNLGYTNWFNFANKIIEILSINCIIKPVNSTFFKNDVSRPKFTVTDKSKIVKSFNLKLNNWADSLKLYLEKDLN